jgi:hypothetical protein
MSEEETELDSEDLELLKRFEKGELKTSIDDLPHHNEADELMSGLTTDEIKDLINIDDETLPTSKIN